MPLPHLLQEVIDELCRHPSVEAVLLAGSRGKNRTPDVASDFDLYVYLNGELPVQVRTAVLQPRCSSLEINNQFWETEDDVILNDGTEVELIYRTLDEFAAALNAVVFGHRATVGYSTCLWDNLMQSQLLFDRNGRLAQLMKTFEVPYPRELAQNIVAKNWPLLGESSTAYRHQIAKAMARQDWISVQHRLAAYLASVFDLVFAGNLARHPGEKRLRALALALPRVPEGLAGLLDRLTGPASVASAYLLPAVDQLTATVGEFLASEGFLATRTWVSAKATLSKPAPRTGELTIYTDGGCIGNPGKGAWAYLVEDGSEICEGTGGEALTTNNRMELQAVIQALTMVCSRQDWDPRPVTIHTDSQYVRNGITAWIKSWEANGWKTAAKEPVKNKELWMELQAWDKKRKPQWKWVKGHAGNPRNERCDALVRQTMEKL